MYRSSARNDSRTWLEQDTEPYILPQRPLDYGDIGVDPVAFPEANALWQRQHARDEVSYTHPRDHDAAQDLPQDVRAIGDDDSYLLSPRAYPCHQNSEILSPISAREGSRSPLSPQTPISPSWERHITDDGLSCYFVDRNNGRVSWIDPNGDAPPPYSEDHPSPSPQSSGTSPLSCLSMFSPAPLPQITRPLPSVSEFSRSQTYTASGLPRVSAHHIQRHRSASAAPAEAYNLSPAGSPRWNRPLPSVPGICSPTRNFPVKIPPASALPTTPSMSPKHRTLEELYESAQEALVALRSFVESLHPQEILDPQAVEDYVLAVLSAVRSLLYISATPVDGIPSHLYPAGRRLRESENSAQIQGLPPQMKRLYWDVIRTLSNLVSCSLAVQFNNTVTIEKSELDVTTAEVQRSLSAFVSEVRHTSEHTPGRSIKRLHGIFMTTEEDQGMQRTPYQRTNASRALDQEAVVELKSAAATIERKILSLVSSSNDSYQRTARLQVAGQSIIARLSAFVKLLQDIDVDQHIEQCREDMEYSHTKGRLLSRTLSEAIQLLQDYNASFFMITQASSKVALAEINEVMSLVRTLDVIASSVVGSLGRVITTLEALVSLTPQFVQGSSSRYSSSTITRAIVRPDSPTLSDYCRPSTTSSLDSRHKKTSGVVLQVTEQRRLSIGGRPSTSSSTISDIRRPSTSSAEVYSPLSASTLFPNTTSTAFVSESQDQDEIVDMVSALMRPHLGVRTSLDSDTDEITSSRSNLFPSLPSLDFSDDPFGTDDDGVEVTTPPSGSSIQISPRIRVPAPRQTLGPRLQAGFSNSSLTAAENNTSPPRGSKLIKVLGKDAPKYYLDTLNADTKPWYLRLDYSPSDVIADPDGTIRAGTTKALVQRLTCHEHGDPVFVKHFLMTYKSFMTLDELFDGLVERFYSKPPEGLTSSEMEQWTKLKQHVIRMRVLNVVKTMLTDDTVLEGEDLHILERMKTFLLEKDVASNSIAPQLLSIVIRMIKNGKTPVKKVTPLISPPSPIVPRSRKNLKLLDIDPLEMARQLTIMESTLYRKIRPAECMARTRHEKTDKVDNITIFIQFSNKLINWIIESVLSKSDAKKRASVVKHFINVANRCLTMQNFSSTVAIVSALNNAAVRRLKCTWEQVGSRASSQFKDCEAIMNPDRNFHNYWSALKDATPPAIPFFGRYLSTLTFINDGAEDKLSGQMINFRKRQKVAEVIQDIKRWQSRPYNFHAVAIVLAFIEAGLNKYSSGVDFSDQFWRLSLEREPRE